MLRLNRLTDYAIVAMSKMSHEPERVRTTTQISLETAVPIPTIAKLLNALVKGGLVISHRGAAGGYTLSRSAEEITAADIIQAVEGPISLTACVDGSDEECGIQFDCPMSGNWNKVNRAIHKALTEVTLAELGTPNPPPKQQKSSPAALRSTG
ncbi:MAG: SUF system Fe-S cluster assembly regulator [Rhodospirillales bacterium]|jgi:FeS assembly SUF system regulator